MKKKTYSPKERAMLDRLAAMPESEIDTDDIPEIPEENWKYARRPGLYRAIKLPVTIRLDADVLAWFKEHAKEGGYQTEINRVLRRHVVGRIHDAAMRHVMEQTKKKKREKAPA